MDGMWLSALAEHAGFSAFHLGLAHAVRRVPWSTRSIHLAQIFKTLTRQPHFGTDFISITKQQAVQTAPPRPL